METDREKYPNVHNFIQSFLCKSSIPSGLLKKTVFYLVDGSVVVVNQTSFESDYIERQLGGKIRDAILKLKEQYPEIKDKPNFRSKYQFIASRQKAKDYKLLEHLVPSEGLLLLCLNPTFRSDISYIRRNLHIPKHGFALGVSQKYDRWIDHSFTRLNRDDDSESTLLLLNGYILKLCKKYTLNYSEASDILESVILFDYPGVQSYIKKKRESHKKNRVQTDNDDFISWLEEHWLKINVERTDVSDVTLDTVIKVSFEIPMNYCGSSELKKITQRIKNQISSIREKNAQTYILKKFKNKFSYRDFLVYLTYIRNLRDTKTTEEELLRDHGLNLKPELIRKVVQRTQERSKSFILPRDRWEED